jgi:hypothetical protein
VPVLNTRQQFCAAFYQTIIMDQDKKMNEGSEAGKHSDMGIKTVEGMDHEGHLHGSNQSTFNERRTQEHERNDDNELNKTDARGTVGGTESV